MKNLIRKILKEESNDIDWIKDTITTKLSEDEDWILVNDVDPKSLEVSHQIQQYLFDLGYSWNTDNSKPLKNFYIHSIYHYGQLRGYDEGQMYYADGYNNSQIRTSKRDIASGKYMVYYWSDLKPKTINESDELDWIRKATPSKWDYFEEMIKDEPTINIEKNEDGEWVNFKDAQGRQYFGFDFCTEYGLKEDIKSNSLPDFLNVISQHMEVTFQGYDYEQDEDYWDFLTLKEVLEKANKKV